MFVIKHLSPSGMSKPLAIGNAPMVSLSTEHNLSSVKNQSYRGEDRISRASTTRMVFSFMAVLASLSVSLPVKAQVNTSRRRPRIGCEIPNAAFQANEIARTSNQRLSNGVI